jgi:hypothetical protein
MKNVFFITTIFLFTSIVSSNCKRPEHHDIPVKKYPADVAIAWMNLHMRLNMTTPNFNSVVGGRSFGYAALTLYESVAPGIDDCRSIADQLSEGKELKKALPSAENAFYYWPASANAAMASITKALFGNTSQANIATIDSLEAAFRARFQQDANGEELSKSETFGRKVADAIFNWSKADGGHEPYLHVTEPGYVLPVGPSFWIPTPPAFAPAPIHPYWGKKRSFVSGVVGMSQPGAPVPYSEDKISEYYKGVNELYTISLSLRSEDSTIAKFWGDLATNFNVPAHATGILTQIIILNHLKLDQAAIAYAKHSLAMSDALVSVFKTKYTYTTIRPVSYIRNIMKHPNWNTVIPTPPHPEYSAAHAVVSGASAEVLEAIFGKNYAFTDHSYDKLYGSRTFSSFDAYAKEAGFSRVLAGIHYRTSVNTGLLQGRKVGHAVNSLDFRKNGQSK